MDKDKTLCMHAPCSCAPLPMQDYCSEWCKDADLRKDPLDIHCHCQHPDCGGEPEIPIETESMLIASTALAEA